VTITKDKIVSRIAEEMEYEPLEARRQVDTIIDIIKRSLACEQPVLISGFGKFSIRKKRSRLGRNPQTGTPLYLKARQVVTFKISGVLKRKLTSTMHLPNNNSAEKHETENADFSKGPVEN
jgi:integration host factor subunit alpha